MLSVADQCFNFLHALAGLSNHHFPSDCTQFCQCACKSLLNNGTGNPFSLLCPFVSFFFFYTRYRMDSLPFLSISVSIYFLTNGKRYFPHQRRAKDTAHHAHLTSPRRRCGAAQFATERLIAKQTRVPVSPFQQGWKILLEAKVNTFHVMSSFNPAAGGFLTF